MISLVIPAYNCENFIEKSLQSIFSQSLPRERYEIVVVNDGSTDGTGNILKRFHSQIVLINQTNQGLSGACNQALRAARGDCVMRLDPDDYYDPELLRHTLSALEERPDCHCVYTDRYEVDARTKLPAKVAVGEGNVFDMVACGVLFRKDTFDRLGQYRDLLFEEYDFMVRFFENGLKAYYLQEPLYYYVRHESSMTGEKGYWEKGWGQLVDVWGVDKLRKYVDIQTKVRGRSKFPLGEGRRDD